MARRCSTVRRVARSAVTGRFVRVSYAVRHPRITVIHRVRVRCR